MVYVTWIDGSGFNLESFNTADEAEKFITEENMKDIAEINTPISKLKESKEET